jgi:hypothetical protein
MDHTNGDLPKMLPGFEQQPNIENPDAPAEVEENGLAAEPVDPAAEKDQAPAPRRCSIKSSPSPATTWSALERLSATSSVLEKAQPLKPTLRQSTPELSISCAALQRLTPFSRSKVY